PRALVVWSGNFLVHSYRVIRRMRYGPGSARERHDDRGGPSSDTTQSREPESAGQALRRQSEDPRPGEGADLSRRAADRTEEAQVNGLVSRGRGGRRRLPKA